MPSHALDEEQDQPCRACTNFQSWARKQKNPPHPDKPGAGGSGGAGGAGRGCPLDKEELGRSTWGFLHTMAAYYPERASPQEASDMKSFLNIFAQFYPCEPCALDLRADVQAYPPRTSGRAELARWMCDRHNTVNIKLGKPLFDCSKHNERWKDGWLDGSCD